MTFSWLGFIVGFLSGIVWLIVIAKITEFIRFMIMAKYQAKTKGKEGDNLDELTKQFKEGFGVTGIGDKDREAK